MKLQEKQFPPEAYESFNFRIKEMLSLLEETDVFMAKEMNEPSPAAEGDNMIHVNRIPITEFKRLMNEQLAFDEVLGYYERWNEILWEQALSNFGFYDNIKVRENLIQLRMVMVSFQDFFKTTPTTPITTT